MKCLTFMARVTCFYLALIALRLSPALAAANSGIVYGYINIWHAEEDFCPSTGANCTGALYVQASYNTPYSVRDATVFLTTSSGVQLGWARSGPDGAFTIQYDTNQSVSSVFVYWIPEHADGRFAVKSAGGGYITYSTAAAALTAGTGKLKNWGAHTWGTSIADSVRGGNIYAGARKTYNNALALSNQMANNFFNVTIYIDRTDCPTGCLSNPTANLDIYLPTNASYRSQERVMHEVGHAASYIASPPIRSNNGTLGLHCGDGGNGWGFTTAEYWCTASEEGFSSFVAARASYNDSATDVRTCTVTSTQHCYSGTSDAFNIEAHDLLCAAAGATRNWPGTTLGYLWDTIDNNDGVNFNFYDVIDTLAAYDVGFGDHQVNEQYDSTWAIDDVNGRSIEDVSWNMRYDSSGPHLNSDAARLANCGN